MNRKWIKYLCSACGKGQQEDLNDANSLRFYCPICKIVVEHVRVRTEAK